MNNIKRLKDIINSNLIELLTDFNDNEPHIIFSRITNILINSIKENDLNKTAKIINVVNEIVELDLKEGIDAISTTLFISLYDEFYNELECIPLNLFSPKTKKIYDETIYLWKKGNNIK